MDLVERKHTFFYFQRIQSHDCEWKIGLLPYKTLNVMILTSVHAWL